MASSVPDVTILSVEEFQRRAGTTPNPFLSVLVDGAPDTGLRYTVARWEAEPHPRAIDSVSYIDMLANRHRALMRPQASSADPILFQGEDNPSNVASVSWQGRRDWTAIKLVPDLYYFLQKGYEDFLRTAPDWSSRHSRLIWRGSSTGILFLPHHRLQELPRYRLCREALRLGTLADVKLTSIVQAASDADLAAIEGEVRAENLFGGWVPMAEMAHCRYVVDIDGNANSWNFMMKLRLGACMLKVETEWTQWFSNLLQPWVHYVPVRADLADLVERVEWCRDHDAQAAEIARAGRQMALDMRYETQMDAAALTLFS